jgi:hypothetical protein
MAFKNAAGEWTGNRAQMFKAGERRPYQIQPGETRNPGGMSRARREFEQAFYRALICEGSATEAAKLLWECARAKEPWAIQLLLQRIAPQDSKIKLEVSRDDDGFDPTRLTDEQLDQFIKLAELAQSAAPQLESGEVQAESEDFS